jgi:hypothetical protein
MELSLIPDRMAICRLGPEAARPDWLGEGGLVSVTRTPDELSIVCPQDWVPKGVECQRDWIAFKVHGPIDFEMVGVLASLSAALADAGLSLFALSTYDTDYLLVRAGQIGAARQALADAGHTLTD